MEGITVEIRNRIKCAVKAKLQEIGAYLDEELPDYIMVNFAILNKLIKKSIFLYFLN